MSYAPILAGLSAQRVQELTMICDHVRASDLSDNDRWSAGVTARDTAAALRAALRMVGELRRLKETAEPISHAISDEHGNVEFPMEDMVYLSAVDAILDRAKEAPKVIRQVRLTGGAHRSNGRVRVPVVLEYLRGEPVEEAALTAEQAVLLASYLTKAAHSLMKGDIAKEAP